MEGTGKIKTTQSAPQSRKGGLRQFKLLNWVKGGLVQFVGAQYMRFPLFNALARSSLNSCLVHPCLPVLYPCLSLAKGFASILLPTLCMHLHHLCLRVLLVWFTVSSCLHW